MSAIEISPELLQEVKDYLDITWEDEVTDRKLKGQIRRGIAFIADKTGVDRTAETFSGEGDERAQMLLFNYLLYDRAGALDQFVRNYRSEIIGLKLIMDVKRGPVDPSGAPSGLLIWRGGDS